MNSKLVNQTEKGNIWICSLSTLSLLSKASVWMVRCQLFLSLSCVSLSLVLLMNSLNNASGRSFSPLLDVSKNSRKRFFFFRSWPPHPPFHTPSPPGNSDFHYFCRVCAMIDASVWEGGYWVFLMNAKCVIIVPCLCGLSKTKWERQSNVTLCRAMTECTLSQLSCVTIINPLRNNCHCSQMKYAVFSSNSN